MSAHQRGRGMREGRGASGVYIGDEQMHRMAGPRNGNYGALQINTWYMTPPFCCGGWAPWAGPGCAVVRCAIALRCTLLRCAVVHCAIFPLCFFARLPQPPTFLRTWAQLIGLGAKYTSFSMENDLQLGVSVHALPCLCFPWPVSVEHWAGAGCRYPFLLFC